MSTGPPHVGIVSVNQKQRLAGLLVLARESQTDWHWEPAKKTNI